MSTMDKTHQTMIFFFKKKAHYDKGYLQKNKSFKKLLNIFNGETLSICSLNKVSPSAIRQERRAIILLKKREENLFTNGLTVCIYDGNWQGCKNQQHKQSCISIF